MTARAEAAEHLGRSPRDTGLARTKWKSPTAFFYIDYSRYSTDPLCYITRASGYRWTALNVVSRQVPMIALSA